MKKNLKSLMLLTAVAVLTVNAAECAAQDSIKVKVTNIQTFTGNIMVASGDYNNPLGMSYTMVPATSETVECILTGEIEPGDGIFAFHDANGNFNLDMDENKMPVEGHFAGTIETDESGTMVIVLKYPEQAVAEESAE